MTVRPGSERYLTLLERVVLADAKLNWLLGDTALELAPNDPRDPVLSRFIDDLAEQGVNVTRERLLNCRLTSAAWPLRHRRSDRSWKVHDMLATNDRRHELIEHATSVTATHRLLGHSTAGRTGPQSAVSHVADQVAQALRNPDVARRVAEDPTARHAMSRATDQYHQKRQATGEGRRTADPVAHNLDQRDAVIALGQACEQFARAVLNGIPNVEGVPDSERPWFESSVNRAGAAHQILQTLLDTGRTEMDAGLRALLEGEAR